MFDYYWTSTTYADGTTDAWSVNLFGGYVILVDKTSTDYVLPVRGGQ